MLAGDLKRMESGLIFLLYHLIFESEENVLSFDGFSESAWEEYKSKASDRLLIDTKAVLEWAYQNPDYNFAELINPVKKISSSALYQYVCRFRSSIENFQT